MSAGLNQAGGVHSLLFETRKALIIINLQNDSLYVKNDTYVTKNRDYVYRLKKMIPYFRKDGEVVWVQTHMGIIAPPPAPEVAKSRGGGSKSGQEEPSRTRAKRKASQGRFAIRTSA